MERLRRLLQAIDDQRRHRRLDGAERPIWR
jgi:hypothetical protein